jgi:hypothetical protein
MSEDGEKKKSPWAAVAIGCGALVVGGGCLACFGPSLYGFWLMDQMGGSGSYTAPAGTPSPEYTGSGGATGGLELPAPTGPVRDRSAPPPAPAAAYGTFEIAFTVLSSDRTDLLAQGESCRFTVTQTGTAGCQTRVQCRGHVLYGDEGQGFFSCTTGDGTFTGADGNTTDVDGDASIAIGSAGVTLRDSASGANGAFTIVGLRAGTAP